jgi:chloride channel protein, CIC family
LRPADLARYLESQDPLDWEDEAMLDLMAIPADRRELAPLHAGATLREAWILMKNTQTNAVYVSRPAAPLMSDIAGVITQEDIEAYYQV